jgi:hypothetical protein
MNQPTPQDLAAALTDVRRAYRLVYAYQRRMNDLVAEIDAALTQDGLEFELWRPVFNAPPPRSGTPYFRGRWAWDMLPGYATQVHWCDPTGKKGRRRRVVLQAVVDSGATFDAAEPDPADFEAADACESQLRIGLWTTTATQPTWDAAWAAVSARDAYWDGVQEVDVDGSRYTYEYVGVDVSRLVDAKATRALVLDRLAGWAAAARKAVGP